MIPLYLNPSCARIALVGRGRLALRRLRWLRDGGAAPLVWSDAPEAEFAADAGEGLVHGLPGAEDLRGVHALWIADLPRDAAESLASVARSLGILVNVEDVVELCDFHTPAVVRRGKLTLAAGTGGASPAAARAARERLEEAFPQEWAEALREIEVARGELRREGAGFDALVSDARARLFQHGLA